MKVVYDQVLQREEWPQWLKISEKQVHEMLQKRLAVGLGTLIYIEGLRNL